MLHRVVINSGLQGLNLLGKALLLLLLTRYLPVADVGLFGLLAGTLTLALFGVGLGFRWFSVRQMVCAPREQLPCLVRDQMVLHALSYLVLLPALLLVFAFEVLPWPLAGWFYALLVLDHLNEELYRFLVTLSRPGRATVHLFLRQAAWIYALAVVILIRTGSTSLQAVLGCWFAAEAAALVLAISCLRDLPWKVARRTPINWPWLGRGLREALPLMSANLAFSGMGLADRYALEAWRGVEQVGVYTFYAYARNAIGSVLDVGVLNLFQPRILAAYQEGNRAEYHRLMRRLFAAGVGLAVLLCTGAALLIRPVVLVIGKPVYREHLDTFGLVLLVTVVATALNLSLLALYARHADRLRVGLSLVGLAGAAALNALLVPPLGLNGAALATLGAHGMVAVSYLCFLWRAR